MRTKIAVTGIGLISPLGHQNTSIAENLEKGKPGLSSYTHPRLPRGTSLKCGFINQDFAKLLGGTGWRHHSKSSLMACFATRQMLADSQTLMDDAEKQETGVIVGYNPDAANPLIHASHLAKNMRLVNPMAFINLSGNAPASLITVLHQFRGMVLSVSTRFTAGLEALDLAATALAAGRSRIILAGGVAEITPELAQSFALSYLEANRNREAVFLNSRPAGAVCAGEGCSLFQMETEDRARACGRAPRAYILGFGSAAQPGCAKGDDPTATVMAIRRALAQAEISPPDIQAVFLAANGNSSQEAAEARALENIFQNSLPPATAVKSIWGDAYFAGGNMAAAAAILCLERNFLPPTLNAAPSPWTGRMRCHPQAQKIQAQHVLILAMNGDQKSTALILELPV